MLPTTNCRSSRAEETDGILHLFCNSSASLDDGHVEQEEVGFVEDSLGGVPEDQGDATNCQQVGSSIAFVSVPREGAGWISADVSASPGRSVLREAGGQGKSTRETVEDSLLVGVNSVGKEEGTLERFMGDQVRDVANKIGISCEGVD